MSTQSNNQIQQLADIYKEVLTTKPRQLYHAVAAAFGTDDHEQIFNIINLMTVTFVIELPKQEH